MTIGPVGTHPFDSIELASLRNRHGNKFALWKEPVIPAWVADMDFPVAAPISAVVAQAVAKSDWCYPPETLRQAFAEAGCEWMRRRHGLDADAGLSVLLNDVVQGVHLAVMALTDRRDDVIVHTPSYPPFLETIDELDRGFLDNAMVLGGHGFEFDMNLLRTQARTAKLLILCNPQNPTGRVMTRTELTTVAEIVVENNLVVIADEIWADLVAPGQQHIAFASISAEIAERTVTLISPSKPFNMAGLRAALMIFGGATLKDRVMGVIPSHLLGTINTAGLLAGISAYTECDEWLADTNEYLDINRRYVAQRFALEVPGVRHIPGQGTYVAWFDCAALPIDGDARHWFVKHALVGLSEGKNFGAKHRTSTRLNFATSRPILAEILDRMCRAVETTRN